MNGAICGHNNRIADFFRNFVHHHFPRRSLGKRISVHRRAVGDRVSTSAGYGLRAHLPPAIHRDLLGLRQQFGIVQFESRLEKRPQSCLESDVVGVSDKTPKESGRRSKKTNVFPGGLRCVQSLFARLRGSLGSRALLRRPLWLRTPVIHGYLDRRTACPVDRG